MRAAGIAASAALVLTFGTMSCQSALDCNRAGCSADVEPPWGTPAQCQQRLAGTCGFAWAPLAQCMQNHESCTSSSFSDTNAIDAACNNESAEWIYCCEGPDAEAATKGC